MADERNLGVRITATDSAAPAIQSLSAELEKLVALQKLFASGLSSAAVEAVAATIKQTEAIRAQIQVLQAQQNAFQASAAAAREMRLEASLGPATERQISSAAASAKVLATSLSLAASADNTLREAQIAAGLATDTATAALKRQADVLYALTGARARASTVSALTAGQFGAATTARLVRPEASTTDIAAQRAAITRVFEEDFALTQALSGTQLAYKDAAESAKVFERSGVSAARSVAVGSAEAAAGTAVVSREIRHLVAGADELQRHQIGAFFSTLGAAARDAGLGVVALVSSVGGLFAILGAAAVVRGAEAMGKWATSVQSAAAASGMSVNQFTRLDGAMQLLGGKALGTDEALRGFARSLGQAVSDPTSKAAQAFHALGISQDELVAHSKNTYDALLFFADAWNRVNDSTLKADAGQIIYRGGLEHILPLISRGTAGVQELAARAEALGITLNDDSARALATTAQKADELSEVIRGKAIQAFVAWGPAIQQVIDTLNVLGQIIGPVVTKLGDIAAHPIDIISPGTRFIAEEVQRRQEQRPSALVAGATAGAGQAGLAGMVPARGGIEAGPITGAATVQQSNELELAQASAAAWAKAKDTASGRIAAENAIIGVLEKQLTAAKAVAASQNASEESRKEVVRIETQLARERQSLSETTLSQGATAARKSYEDFVAGEREKVAEAGKDFAAIAAIYDEWLAEAKRLYGEDSKQFKVAEREKVLAAEAAGRERIRIINQGASDTARMQEAQALQARLVAIQGGAQPGQLADPGTVIAAGQQAAQQILATGWKEIYDLQVEAAKDGASGAVEAQDDANRRILSTWNETVQKLIENYDKITAYAKRSAEESSRAYVQFFDRVGSQVDTFGKSLLDALVAPHTETILEGIQYRTVSLRTQEIRQAFGKLVEGMSSDLFNALTSAISQAIAQSLVKNIFTNITLQPGEGIGALFGKAVGGLFGNQAQAPSVASMGLSSTDIQGFSNALKQGTNTATTNLGNFNDALVKSTMALRNQVASVGGGGGGSGGSSGTGTVQQAIQESSDKEAATSNTQTLATVGAIASLGSLLGSAIGGSAGRIVSGLLGALTLIANLLLLLNVKPSILGFSYAGGGVVPSAAGGWRVPSAAGGMVTAGRSDGILSILHPNEMVLPANISQAVQNMAGSGGGGGNNFAVTFQVQALDAQGVNAFFKNNGPALAAAFANQVRANNPNIMRTAKGFA